MFVNLKMKLKAEKYIFQQLKMFFTQPVKMQLCCADEPIKPGIPIDNRIDLGCNIQYDLNDTQFFIFPSMAEMVSDKYIAIEFRRIVDNQLGIWFFSVEEKFKYVPEKEYELIATLQTNLKIKVPSVRYGLSERMPIVEDINEDTEETPLLNSREEKSCRLM